MDLTARPPKRSRVARRHRYPHQTPSSRNPLAERDADPTRKEERPIAESLSVSLGRRQGGVNVMTRAHKLFHRQAAQSTGRTLTVGVEVIATVDSNGVVVAQETVTPSAAVVPSVPAYPSNGVPSVPSVPAFPSTLTVPAYPFPASSAQAEATTQATLSSALSSGGVTSVPTSVAASSSFNSTSSSTQLSSTPSTSSTSLSTSGSSSSSTSPISSTSSSISSSSTSSISSTRSSSSTRISSTSTAAASSATDGVYAAPAPANTSAASAPANTAVADSTDNSGPLGTPQVVGSVVGSLAGVALILALILFLIKRHKRKQHGGVLQLPDAGDNQPIASSGQQMATRSSHVPTFLNRFSGVSRSTAETSTGEKSFQRISGRKLPSAFSEGMTSEQFARGDGTLSGSSFYKDDTGFYGGPGKESGKEGEAAAVGVMGTKERFMPSPARTPIIHHPDDAPDWGTSRNGGNSTLSPPHSPNPDWPPRPTLGRSHPSHDGSRSSRFTENV